MGKARSMMVAAIAAMLIAAGGTPAFAADPLVVSTTGLTDGQSVGQFLLFYPKWSGGAAVYKVSVLLDDTVNFTAYNGTQGAFRLATIGLPADGSKVVLTVRIYDIAGAEASASTPVVIDRTKPTATFTPRQGGATPLGGVVTVTATDLPADVAEVAVMKDNDGTRLATATSAPWTITYHSAGGPSYVYLRVTDRAANYTQYPGYYLDNTPPTVGSLDFLDGPDGRVKGKTQLGVGFSGGVNSYEIYADGVPAGSYAGGSTYNSYVTVSGGRLTHDFGTQPRTATVDVLARDVAGNAATKTFTVVVDPTGPVITSVTPAGGALVRGSTITGTLRATDPAGIAYATLNSYVMDGTTTRTVAIPAGADGRKTLIWRVDDRLFNESTITRYVIVDNTEPTVKITKGPKNGALVKGTVTVDASAADRNGIARVDLLINGKLVARDVTAAYSFKINTKKYGTKIRVQLRAYDRAGNVKATTTRTWHR